MSTQPGVTTRPSASISRRAVPSTAPTSVTIVPSTATSPWRSGPPEPSAMVPPRMIRSCIGAPLPPPGRPEAGRSSAPSLGASDPTAQLLDHAHRVWAHRGDVEVRHAGLGQGGHLLLDGALGAAERGAL